MVSKKDRVLLLSFHLFKEIDEDLIGPISDVMGIKIETFGKYVSGMKKKGLVKKLRSPGRKYYVLTDQGEDHLLKVLNDLDHCFFTSDRHGIKGSIKITEVIDKLDDPLLKLLLISLYFSSKNFDLMHALHSIDVMKNETNLIGLLESGDHSDDPGIAEDFARGFMDTTIYGLKPLKDSNRKIRNRFEGMLIEAEVLLEDGEYDKSLDLFDNILKDKKIKKNIWLLAEIGRIRTLARMDRIDEMEKEIEFVKSKTDNNLAIAYLTQIQADIYTSMERYDEAGVLFKRALKTFEIYGYPLLLGLTHNNYGVYYFNIGDLEKAKKQWYKSLSIITKDNIVYQIPIMSNLISIIRKEGNIDQAEFLIDRYEEIINEINILRFYQGIYYNRSLLELSKGNLNDALNYFKESMVVSAPYPTKIIREEMKRTFIQEAKEMGYDIQTSIL